MKALNIFKKPIIAVAILSFSSCSSSSPIDYQEFAKEMAKKMVVNPIYKTILDEYYSNNYSDLQKMVQTDKEFCKEKIGEYRYVTEYNSSLDDVDINDLKREDLRIGYAAGNYNGAYLVYLCYKDYIYRPKTDLGVWLDKPTNYKIGENDIGLYLGNSFALPHDPLLYYNHEFLTIEEGIEQGFLTEDNTYYLQSSRRPYASFFNLYNQCAYYVSRNIILADTDSSHLCVFIQATRKAVANYLNASNKFKIKISADDVYINFGFSGFHREQFITYDVPKLDLTSFGSHTEYKIIDGDYILSYKTPGNAEPLAVKYSELISNYEAIVELTSIQNYYNSRTSNKDEHKISYERELLARPIKLLEEITSMVNDGTLGLWGTIDNFDQYFE